MNATKPTNMAGTGTPIAARMIWKKLGAGVVVVMLAAFVFLLWYRAYYSMDVAETFELNPGRVEHRVLIATQGSDFKNALVDGLLAHLREKDTYVRVIDVSALAIVDEAEWDAVVILHTWEYGEPPIAVRGYVEHAKNLDDVIVLGTSGSGTLKIKGIDAISSASVMTGVSARVADITRRLDTLLD